ncbi:mannose-1-phosphate guanylyltransferase [Aquimarina litoralis]|uniref:mannose-1-phosphate guanylyltransferase n=1 Tax=Aquimarina litoralis TaxID=584605 RepID=UPI001C5823BC|nr:mannose-1-phosphate guanylyltransferase [Aquimarina litoralis]MBW1293888.1 NTP transferase domain-containing protein [Aquimarina litoralis]
MNKIINVVLSGGSGTRLWPLSRKSKPKQFLKIFDDQSLFQHTINRNKKLVDDFLLITNTEQIVEANEQINEISENFSNKVIEPIGRNTAPAIALTALCLNPNDIMFVTPCDHMITNTDVYKTCLDRAIQLAKKNYLVTFGIKPTAPEVGFGYIEYDKEEVLSFREKPDKKTAEKFLNSGSFLWNSGMFCFKAKTYLEELKKHRKDIYQACFNAITSAKDGLISLDKMKTIPDESVDYAVFEKSDKIKTVPSDFGWTDLGTFDSLIDFFQNEESEVNDMVEIDGVDLESTYYLGNKKVFGLGVSNITVVETNDCIVVLGNGKSQDVKKLYKLVEEKNKSLL